MTGGPWPRAGLAHLMLVAAVSAGVGEFAGEALAAAWQPPNIVLILVDDAGYMDFGGYGGEARTPTIDALAEDGVRFTNYHTSPLCAPSRAMLLTGVDNHLTGVATIPEVLDDKQSGRSGYAMHLSEGVETVASKLQRAGYRTYMAGKWHLGHRPEDLPDAHGFDRSLALDASGADNWEQKPYMPYYDSAPWFEDGGPVTLPEDFYSSELLVDRLIDYLDADGGDERPFFAYLSFLAVHIPIQAPRPFTDHYEDTYDAGWDALRQARWQRARELGLIPDVAPLAPMHPLLRRWDSLAPAEQRLYARSMAVNAGMLEAMDHHVGRFVDYLRRRGEFGNTVFVITSDNGPELNEPTASIAMRWWLR
ncbi:MAG: sulfatase-like hydrolase/transferase, partial [Gammaproteobacteria bacterium]